MDEGEGLEWVVLGVDGSKDAVTLISRDLPRVSRNNPPKPLHVESDGQDLLEELLSNLVHLIVEVPLL